MESEKQLQLIKKALVLPAFFVLSIWGVYIIELQFGYNFNKFGIYPRSISGLKGIFFAPFIHSNIWHLFNNSVPLFVLLASINYFYKEVALKIIVFGGLLTGLLTWFFARESYHIGASGLVYLLFSFVLFSGMIRKNYRLIALSLVVIFLYGSMIWYVFPIEDKISWEGHLSGFVVGLILAFLYQKRGISKEEFQFTKTAFDDLFDEEGNLITTENEDFVHEKE